MNARELSLDFKDVVLDFAWLSLLLIFGTIIRRYGKFFQKPASQSSGIGSI